MFRCYFHGKFLQIGNFFIKRSKFLFQIRIAAETNYCRKLLDLQQKDQSKNNCSNQVHNKHDNNSVHFRESILWNDLPSSIKNSQTINEFKLKRKNSGNIHCTCGVCR